MWDLYPRSQVRHLNRKVTTTAKIGEVKCLESYGDLYELADVTTQLRYLNRKSTTGGSVSGIDGGLLFSTDRFIIQKSPQSY
jgi:hypothetical protein